MRGLPAAAVGELALDQAGVSCFATPSAAQFEEIEDKVRHHLARGGAEDRFRDLQTLGSFSPSASFGNG